MYPITGRTHQLRVHAAHKNGLNTPILGDDLYGEKSNISKNHFKKIVLKAKRYIKKGDIFQVVLSQRFETNLTKSPINIYKKLTGSSFSWNN